MRAWKWIYAIGVLGGIVAGWRPNDAQAFAHDATDLVFEISKPPSRSDYWVVTNSSLDEKIKRLLVELGDIVFSQFHGVGENVMLFPRQEILFSHSFVRHGQDDAFLASRLGNDARTFDVPSRGFPTVDDLHADRQIRSGRIAHYLSVLDFNGDIGNAKIGPDLGLAHFPRYGNRVLGGLRRSSIDLQSVADNPDRPNAYACGDNGKNRHDPLCIRVLRRELGPSIGLGWSVAGAALVLALGVWLGVLAIGWITSPRLDSRDNDDRR